MYNTEAQTKQRTIVNLHESQMVYLTDIRINGKKVILLNMKNKNLLTCYHLNNKHMIYNRNLLWRKQVHLKLRLMIIIVSVIQIISSLIMSSMSKTLRRGIIFLKSSNSQSKYMNRKLLTSAIKELHLILNLRIITMPANNNTNNKQAEI